MNCIFCGNSEYKNGEEALFGKDATSIICSNCLQKLISLDRDQLEKSKQKYYKKERYKEAEYIENMLLNMERKEDGLKKIRKRKAGFRFSGGRDTLGNFRDNKRNTGSIDSGERFSLY